MDKTIQNARIALYGALGGNSAALTDRDKIGALICAIAKLDLGAEISGAAVKELPAFPESDGTYTLQLVMDEGTPALTWEAAE